jgi:hypothetical protein
LAAPSLLDAATQTKRCSMPIDVNQSATAGQRERNDVNWDELLGYIEVGEVIPIVGSALSVVNIGGREMSIERFTADSLIRHFGLELANLEPLKHPRLNDVVSCYLRQHGKEKYSHLVHKIWEILSKAQFIPPPALRRLAQIRHFNLFVTTAFDTLLETAINQLRFGGSARVQSISYDPKKVVDIIVGQPTVYYLFGKLYHRPNYVITDEDLLEYLCAMHGYETRPKALLEQLKNNHLLILGCNFPDWIARIMLRTAKGARLSLHRDPLEILADERSDFHENLKANRQTKADPGLVIFLRNFSTKTIVLDQDASGFVETLSEKLKERARDSDPLPPAVPVPPPPQMPEGAIFISYSRDDLPAVQVLKSGLEAAGLPVWFDMDQLRIGDTWEGKLIDNIHNCSLFVPIISRHTESDLKDAYFRKEWYYAEQRDLRNAESVRFILPVLLDISPSEISAVPRRFLEKHLETLPGGQVTPNFVRELLALLPAQQ